MHTLQKLSFYPEAHVFTSATPSHHNKNIQNIRLYIAHGRTSYGRLPCLSFPMTHLVSC
jgi:hypothetical protein